MSLSFESFQKRRLITSYFSVVLSIFVVLFLLGILGFFIINSRNLSNSFRERIAISVYLNDNISASNLDDFKKELTESKMVKSFKFVSKEDAAKKLNKDLGEDFINFLGTNPLQNSIDIYLKSEFVEHNNISSFENELRKNNIISDVVYEKELVGLVNKNIKKVSFWLLILSSIFVLMAVILINSSIRLSIYSNRFIIKTMQMVGATKSFIRMPFIWRSVKLGMIGAGIAIVFLIAVLFYFEKNYAEIGILEDKLMIFSVLLGVFVAGIIITFISTFFATQRFLNLRTDDLY